MQKNRQLLPPSGMPGSFSGVREDPSEFLLFRGFLAEAAPSTDD